MDGIQIARQLIADESAKKTGFLDLGNLQLTEVPVELFELTHLRGLNLGSWHVEDRGEHHKSSSGDENHSNMLSALPNVIGALENLLRLSLFGNPISDLGPLLGMMSLEILTASSCHFEDFPRQLLFRKNLHELILHETTIPGVPAEVLSADGLSNCLEELRDHLMDTESGLEEVHEAKLVVLGNGRVGKTQICRRLRDLPYDEHVASTHGITVTAEP